MGDRNPMQNIETMEAQIVELKEEQKACKVKTLKNLEKLYKLLNGSDKNSEEEAVVVEEPAAQV